MPYVRAAARGTQPGQPQLRAEPVGDGLELIELRDVLPGHDDRQLESAESGVGQVLRRPHRGRVRAGPANGVVDRGGRAVQRDLHVHVVAGGQPGSGRRIKLHAVGGELHPDVVRGRVVHEFPKVRPDGRLAAADVDVEDLHPLERVDDLLALVRGQLTRVAAAGRGQAVLARQVARVGELPGQADWSVQAKLEQVRQLARSGRPGGRVAPAGSQILQHSHARVRSEIIFESASAARARAYTGSSASGTPAAAQAARALGWSASDRTTVSTRWFLRKDSRRVPKWYSSAPNGSGRIDTRGSTCQGRSMSKPSVDTAHAVDRDLLDQKLVAAQGFRLLDLRRVGGHLLLGHAYLRISGTKCQDWHWQQRKGTRCRNQGLGGKI